ncbi:hypothetical protein ACWIE6_24000 [Paenibacillus taichungensis]
MKNPIHDAFEAVGPSERQKEKMRSEINVQFRASRKKTSVSSWGRSRIVASLVAVFFLLVSATTYAATDGKIITLIKNQVNQILFANGDTIKIHSNDEGEVFVGVSGKEGAWVVEEVGEELILEINGEKINISNSLLDKGYFYYDYYNNSDILHRVYVVKNAGGFKDYSERWYSQFEWLPEHGLSGGSRGISGALATAIMSAETDVSNRDGDLDEMLQKYLLKYWSEYEK